MLTAAQCLFENERMYPDPPLIPPVRIYNIMKIKTVLTVLALGTALLASGLVTDAQAAGGYFHLNPTKCHEARTPWHAPYYHTQYGAPVALVVPPCSCKHTDWSWGVCGTTVRPNYHQFGRSYPAWGYGTGQCLRPTPQWPSSTSQFGVYYVRAPWKR